jgi:hypothetical protein
MKFQPKKSPSPAEIRLTEALKAKADAQAEMDAAQVVRARLETAARSPAPIAAELAMLDKDESAAMSQWAANPNGADAPAPDADRRAELMKRLAAAEAQARASADAMSGPRAAMNAAGQRAATAERAAYIARKLAALEAAELALAPLKSAIARVYEAKRRVDAARESVLAGLAFSDDTREVFTALAAFDKKRLEAESKPLSEVLPPDGAAPDGQHELARALAQLGPVGPWLGVGAPAQSGPQYVNPTRMNPIS